MADDYQRELTNRENAEALRVLAGCVGERLTGYGVNADSMEMRFSNGERVILHVQVCQEVLEEMADVLSAFGRFLGGELRSVTERGLRFHGIGDVTIPL